MNNNSNKNRYLLFKIGRRMKYVRSIDKIDIKAEFTNSKGVLLNAIHTESLLKKLILRSMNQLN